MYKRELIERYIASWKEGDVEKILSILSDDCIIIESHGPTYKGKEIVEKWAHEWLSKGNKINKWDILSYYEIESTAFFEWDFECFADGKEHKIEGISIARFDNDKIAFIREYRTTKERFL